MLDLPPDLIRKIGMKLSGDSLINLCKASKYLNNILCRDDSFWYLKYTHDFKEFVPPLPGNWKEQYKNKLSGDVYVFGSNTFGQLGLGDLKPRAVPTLLPGLKAKAVSAAEDVSAILDSENRIWMFGYVHGLETTWDFTPKPLLQEGIKVKSISTGNAHTLALDFDNMVWVFGNNRYGQLGLGMEILNSPPTKLNLRAKSISAGMYYSMVLDHNNSVWVFGINSAGQLGLGSNQNSYFPVQLPGIKAKSIHAGNTHSIIIGLNHEVIAFGYNGSGELGLSNFILYSTPTLVPGLRAKSAAVGNNYTLILDTEGVVWGSGKNTDYQLGLLDIDQTNTFKPVFEGAKHVFAGGRHSLVIDVEGAVWVFGNNTSGQLGLSSKVALSRTPTLLPGLRIKSAALGSYHTLIIEK